MSPPPQSGSPKSPKAPNIIKSAGASDDCEEGAVLTVFLQGPLLVVVLAVHEVVRCGDEV